MWPPLPFWSLGENPWFLVHLMTANIVTCKVGFGSTPILPTRSRAGRLLGVEQTKPGESGPTDGELQVSGVLLSWPVASLIVSC